MSEAVTITLSKYTPGNTACTIMELKSAPGLMLDPFSVHLRSNDDDTITYTATARVPIWKQLEQENPRKPTMNHVAETKQFRKDLDATLQEIKGSDRQSRERSLAITKIQEGIMWLGMDLKAQNEETPYPASYDPSNSIIEPTADGLKL